MRDLNDFLQIGGGSTLSTTRFENNGTFTVPKDVRILYVSGAGGGGGGAGGYATRWTEAASMYCAGAGESGEFVSLYPIMVYPGQVIPVTIGRGGVGGEGGLIPASNAIVRVAQGGKDGTSGTATVLGEVLSIAGGVGGSPTFSLITPSSTNMSYPSPTPTPISTAPPRYHVGGILDRNFINNKKVPSDIRIKRYYGGLKLVSSGILHRTLVTGYAIGPSGIPSIGSPLEKGTGADGGVPKVVYRNYDAIAGNGGNAAQFGTGGGGGGGAFCDRGNRKIVHGGKGGNGKKGFIQFFW